MISLISGNILIWDCHGASFVDKKSTVSFTRIIHGEYFFGKWFIEQRQTPDRELIKKFLKTSKKSNFYSMNRIWWNAKWKIPINSLEFRSVDVPSYSVHTVYPGYFEFSKYESSEIDYFSATVLKRKVKPNGSFIRS